MIIVEEDITARRRKHRRRRLRGTSTTWRTSKADVAGGEAWAIIDARIAMTGQSVQVLLFCSSGRHGISGRHRRHVGHDDISSHSIHRVHAGHGRLRRSRRRDLRDGQFRRRWQSPINNVIDPQREDICSAHGDRGCWKRAPLHLDSRRLMASDHPGLRSWPDRTAIAPTGHDDPECKTRCTCNETLRG